MTRPMTIALVSAFPPGRQSLNEYGWHLARALAARPDVAEVVVLADRLEEGASEPAPPAGIRVVRCWDFNRLGTAATLLRALRRERPDGVIYNLQMASFGDRELPAALGLLAPMLSRLSGLPSGVIAHNLVAGVDLDHTGLKGQRLRQAVVRAGALAVTWALCRASYVTVTLQGYADYLAQRFPRARTALVPHGTFDTEIRDWVPFDTRPRRIATMGKFGTYKTLETLLEAFDILRRDPQFADYELVIGGTDHPATPGYVDGLKAARKGDAGVRFAGYVAEEDVAGFFESARLSVFDYRATTGSSGVLHQTASYGAVPLFPRIGDFVDVCEAEGLSGLHYEPGDAAGMADAMRRALTDPAASETIARANRRAAEGLSIGDVAAWHVERLRGGAPAPVTQHREAQANGPA